MLYLTFLHTSFTKIFCQNKLKKNRKLIIRVFIKKADIWYDKNTVSTCLSYNNNLSLWKYEHITAQENVLLLFISFRAIRIFLILYGDS